ncbi:gliding motility lipoprotein GldD [Bacteroidota bacterium]
MKNKVLMVLCLALISCDRSYVPKPSGYLRVLYPEKEYTLYQELTPFEFEYPLYAKIVPHVSKISEPYWYDIIFSDFKGTIYLSYKKLDENVDEYIEDTRALVYKHTARSDGIVEIPFVDNDNKRYGILYELSGEVASPIQFFLTDSSEHFLRGSLYFETTPNRDSLNPIIKFIHQDIEHLIETLRWK